MSREIIFDNGAGKQFDPLSRETLELEEKLLRLDIQPGGRIASTKPVTYKALPKNTVYYNFHKHLVLIHLERGNIVVLGATTGGTNMDRLIKSLAQNSNGKH